MAKATAHDVVVVGAGPAGLAAAASAAAANMRVLLVDDNPAVGGQIWRGEERNPATTEATYWREKVRQAGVEILCGARVFDVAEPGVLLAETLTGVRSLPYWRLVLATGARERFLPFPGWTLPNVMGAGGLQAMAKSGMPIEGKRVVVAGTGPLLLAVASYLAAHGAKIVTIAEQAPMSRLARFSTQLIGMPAKIKQAMMFKRQLAGVPFLTSCWPVAAHGNENLESVTLTKRSKKWNVACDYLACGFHLIPNVELPNLMGCAQHGGFVSVDDWQATSVANVYCAGEPTGIGGVELAVIEGQIAGLSASGRQADARRLFAARSKYHRFAAAMERAFELRPELRDIPSETLLCRCEDVTISRVQPHRSWREAKLHTRCGMGPCQGRVCGGAASFLFGWQTESVRPPVFPAQVAHLAAASLERHSEVEERV
jgi:NADPH-dependent 2,4-dienoyl-CoA reductase/sulfur reductase-like enzyme